MNRTDRLYAIVEELRAIAPRLRTARELAERYEVSIRTIERDIGALQQSGVPIYADVGRRGGYALDKRMSLPPLNFTAAESVALAVALDRSLDTPFAHAGRSALRKILAAMTESDAASARELVGRVGLIEHTDPTVAQGIPPLVEQAVQARRVLEFGYRDRFGAVTHRRVEPLLLLHGKNGWCLVTWCRLRDASRCFRLDRMVDIALTDDPMPPRTLTGCDLDLPEHKLRIFAFG
ncbi:YafY family transcriptional regulator [Nocardia sp. NBC_01503]|uniref:helix-turn-helix transcriptional regulator n=1 Tax=Nocardia sp. NBC_01503 TaxID=2975997 RepID=UPI002E7BB366|nr:YafY family protein [Nocardia sp. NBC_01503]WTL31795.1 YafY family transcriptional regulator [Nocardia sp. NBC_01503]